ncbi:MAG: hypothetical protein WCF78_03690 [archaeon]
MLNILEVINNRKKGQAAITDALFFLTIIVTLSVLLFKFSSTYGDRIDLATSNLYFKEYSNSAMKTIFYSEVPLDYSLDVDNASEVDYLMTSIKADYFKDGVIGKKPVGGNDHQYINEISGEDSDIAKYNLYHTIKAVMYPLPNYDYIFYLYYIDRERFEFVLIKVTNFGDPNPSESVNYQVTYDPKSMKSEYYLCNPINYSVVRNLVAKVNRVYASSIPLQFVVNNQDNQINNTFATWAATTAIKESDLTNSETMNCKLIDDKTIAEYVTTNISMD